MAKMGWDVKGGVAVEKAQWPEGEAAVLDRQHWPIFRTREVHGSKGVPDDDVFPVDRPILGHELRQAGATGMLVDQFAGRKAFSRVVPRDPQVLGREGRAAGC